MQGELVQGQVVQLPSQKIYPVQPGQDQPNHFTFQGMVGKGLGGGVKFFTTVLMRK